MKKICLCNSRVSLVDDDVYNELNQYKWHINKAACNKEYANSTSLGLMHRVITNAKNGESVDHINGDTLDNRKNNLRICKHKENLRNQRISKNNKSGYKGVVISKIKHKNNEYRYWRAQIKVNYKEIFLGHYDTPEEAALAYNNAATKYFGEYALLNEL